MIIQDDMEDRIADFLYSMKGCRNEHYFTYFQKVLNNISCKFFLNYFASNSREMN